MGQRDALSVAIPIRDVKMLKLMLGLLIVLAVMLLLAIIGVLGLWLKGVGSIAFPGLGLIIATRLILAFLVMIEIVVVTLAAFLLRAIYW